MKAGGPLRRGKPLRATKWLRRKETVPRVRADVGGGGTDPSTTSKPKAKPRPKYTGPDLATKILVAGRDGGTCIVPACGREGDTWQHRLARGSGGSSNPEINSPANLIVVCNTHHDWMERGERASARDFGWVVFHPNDPASVPVWVHPGRWVRLLADGTTELVDLPPPNAERAWQP